MFLSFFRIYRWGRQLRICYATIHHSLLRRYLKTDMCKFESQQCYKSEDLLAVCLKTYRKPRDFTSRSTCKANGST